MVRPITPSREREPQCFVPVNGMRGMRASLILNPGAGSLHGDRDAVDTEAFRAAFAAHGITVAVRIAPPRQLGELLEAVIAERPDAIFVGGGDGSISTAAGFLAGSGIPLGVLPLGTLNHFARDLGVPVDWRDAVAALAHGERRAVDVGEVNGRVFINNCSIGSYAEAVRKRDALRRTHGTGKWWAMTLATVAVFRRLRRLRVRLETDGKILALRIPFIVVANNRYSGHVLDHSLRSRLDEGRLWIYTTRAGRHLSILRLMWQSLTRQIDDVDGLEKLAVPAATLTHEHGPLPIAVDGELVDLKPPLHFRIRRAALPVIAPREKPSTE